ncbi:MAG: helix-turn-helix transcriptional regulator [Magnetococcales bacterium]|nr:helix-turn-helix transcriptional regulator [Magnetococcales bacterium]
MPEKPVTFGRAIILARKAKRINQKDLAAMIHKDDDGGPISPQYLNDIEHDRRNPTSDHLIRQFASVLGEDEGYLFVLAGKIPDDLREQATNREQIMESFANFRRNLTNG